MEGSCKGEGRSSAGTCGGGGVCGRVVGATLGAGEASLAGIGGSNTLGGGAVVGVE
jgi:hypothetical protein